ncbi:DUF881 domain-containing protein [Clostridium thermopalmarium]|uniref:Division initiation protein n=1 Tax=Clostridium thermopalmarium DSM 5974 TaxID=1121340 RepID=A0A2T0AWR4_9CLOT|nr:DUF881 domain-containing protein [Clostridium thermopalmarium]PRR75163.1 hypothetical protein CPAL_07150 [Clostridium thermopalmarium DSM 5974]PVZ27919.1 uncharacterized protein YlxW (UPF0749 family) [Clostridium thermopalmarium DSM 5974]
MKTNEANIFIFIASIFIGILIASNMNFSEVNNKVLLTPAEYQEVYDYNRKLTSDIKNLNEKYNDYYAKLQAYKENKNNKDHVLDEMKKEIYNNEIILGNIDVEGEGILINLSDASDEFQENVVDPSDYSTRIVHDSDIVNVINELKIAGAEAISLNGQRITDRSSILCWGVFVELDGIKVPGPFNIKAIGNKDKLYSYMVADGGYISFLKIRGIKVDINKYDKIKILASDKSYDYSFMRELKEK